VSADRRQYADPVDRHDAYPLLMRDETLAERDRARLKVASMSTDAVDLQHLLGVLGLDQPAEIRDQVQQYRT
jgi:DNA-binding PucR family transcriptional regulator